MDLLAIAAATGAGYLAKYWQNIAKERDGSSEPSPSPSSNHNNIESPSLIHSIHGKYSQSKYNDGNSPSSSVDPPECRKQEHIENEGGCVFDNDVGKMGGGSLGSRRSKSSLRSRHLNLQYMKPHGSLDSCLMGHFHGGNDELEEYLCSPLVSPCTMTLRPFPVSDSQRVIGRLSESFNDEVSKKKKIDRDKSRCSSIQFGLEDGSSNGQVLFCLGISIGIICSILSNKLEVENQSENLVQDLQEELEIKDSLTVKELVYDDDSQDAHENVCCEKRMNMLSNQMNANAIVKGADEELVVLKEVECRSKIEAELEAELERLELSMIGSTLQGTLSDDTEFDQDINDDTTPELVHGELNPIIIQQRPTSETLFSPNYGVSPRELSLRLHELIQSRLQDRITHLEEELSKFQKRARELESERIVAWKNSESPSVLGSPVTQPLMNLSNGALDAYNEAYYELNGSHSEGGEGDSDDDLRLIKQIVEKAKQGSAVLRAQRALVYLDD